MFEKLKKHILVIVLLLLAFFVWSEYSSNAKLSDYKEQVLKLKDGEQLFIQQLNEKGQEVVEQQQIILSQKDAIAHNLLEIDRLKKVNAQVTIRTITKIDSVYIPVLDTSNRFLVDTTGLTMLKLPTKFGLNNEWYSLYSTINKQGMLIDSLSLYNRQVITIGLESNGVFKSPTAYFTSPIDLSSGRSSPSAYNTSSV